MLELLKLNFSFNSSVEGFTQIIVKTSAGSALITYEKRTMIVRLQQTDVIKELLCLDKTLPLTYFLPP